MGASTRHRTISSSAWADLNGRWFFAWRMAAACEKALQEVQAVRVQQRDPQRLQALDQIHRLLRRELQKWVRRGEALDPIVERLAR